MPVVGHQVERQARQGPFPARPRRIARGLYRGSEAAWDHERGRTAAGQRPHPGKGVILSTGSVYARLWTQRCSKLRNTSPLQGEVWSFRLATEPYAIGLPKRTRVYPSSSIYLAEVELIRLRLGRGAHRVAARSCVNTNGADASRMAALPRRLLFRPFALSRAWARERP